MNGWRLYYVLRDGRQGMSRNPLASIAIIVMAACAMLMVSGMVWLNSGVQSLAAELKNQTEVRVFLSDKSNAQQIADAARKMKHVDHVRIITSQQTFDNMQQVFQKQVNLQDVFQNNPFPDSLAIQVHDANQVRRIANQLSKFAGVDKVIYGQAYVAKLFALSSALQHTGSVVLAAFVIIALLMITLTLQLAFLARRDEIRIRRLMGSSNAGIYSQFLFEGGILGLAGGVAGALAMALGIRYLLERILALLPLGTVVPGIIPTVLLASLGGLVIGLLGAGLATRRVLVREGVTLD